MNLMLSDAQRTMLRTHGVLLARLFMGVFFLVSGYGKLSGGVEKFSGYIPEMLPLPMLFAWVVIILEIAAGAALIIGYRVGLAAGALAVFLLLTVLLVHNPLSVEPVKFQEELGKALNNLALLGGMLYILAYGPGDGWRLIK